MTYVKWKAGPVCFCNALTSTPLPSTQGSKLARKKSEVVDHKNISERRPETSVTTVRSYVCNLLLVRRTIYLTGHCVKRTRRFVSTFHEVSLFVSKWEVLVSLLMIASIAAHKVMKPSKRNRCASRESDPGTHVVPCIGNVRCCHYITSAEQNTYIVKSMYL